MHASCHGLPFMACPSSCRERSVHARCLHSIRIWAYPDPPVLTSKQEGLSSTASACILSCSSDPRRSFLFLSCILFALIGLHCRGLSMRYQDLQWAVLSNFTALHDPWSLISTISSLSLLLPELALSSPCQNTQCGVAVSIWQHSGLRRGSLMWWGPC